MSRQHYTTARRALINILGALTLTGGGVLLLLAYFDVLVK